MAFSLARNGVVLLALLAVPLVLGDFWAFQLSLFLLFAIATLGVGICWGQAGFLPLGQAMFMALSAYLSGFALIHLGASLWLIILLPLAAAVAGILAYLIGIIVFRGRTESGPFFALITLALGLLAFQIANTWNSVTGGFNGLRGIPGLPGLEGFKAPYYVAVIALALSVALVTWLINAPLGVLWRGLAQNERRLAFFGYNTSVLKAIAFGVSGLLAGIAGALYAPQQNIVTPVLTGFIVSADLVIWAAVGGRRTILGPILGAILIGVVTAELRDRITYWEIIVAAVFIGVVLYLPNGIVGLFAPLERRFARPPRPRPTITAPTKPLAKGPPELAIAGCHLAVGEVDILNDLSLAIDRPGTYCIIGPNGAGKTSTFNMLTGDLRAQRGSVHLDGDEVTGRSADAMALRGVGRKFQIPSIFPDLSIADNLHIALWGGRASLIDLLRPSLRRWDSALLAQLRERFPFLIHGDRLAGALSHGEKQILELAMALVADPRLLLLDEPCAGLSANDTQRVIDAIRWAREALGLTVVIIEHDMALVKELADHIFVIHQGSLLASGTVGEISTDANVHEVYVGASA